MSESSGGDGVAVVAIGDLVVLASHFTVRLGGAVVGSFAGGGAFFFGAAAIIAAVQKEMFHNESLAILDLLLSGQMDGQLQSDPPASPPEGVFFRIADGPSGAWSGQSGKIGAMTAAGWRFVEPFEGLALRDVADGMRWVYAQGAWTKGLIDALSYRVGGQQVVAARQPAIAGPTGGATIDTEARSSIDAILNALRSHGLIDQA